MPRIQPQTEVPVDFFGGGATEPVETVAPEPEVEAQVETEGITLGDSTYTQEELNALVSLGKIAQESETRFNTKIDRVWPEFTKSKNELKMVQQELADIKARQGQSLPAVDDIDETSKAEAIKAAKRLGLLTKEDIEELGLMTRDKFDSQLSEREQANELLKDMRSYAKDVDGSDGRPKFEVEDMLQYMQDTGIRDFKAAYKVRYDEQLDSWKTGKRNSVKREAMPTSRPSEGNKLPSPVRVDRTNFQELMRQALNKEI